MQKSKVSEHSASLLVYYKNKINMDKKELVSLLKSGNFTIAYWDSQIPTIYKGKWNIEKEYDKDEYKELSKHEINFPMYGMNGYLPDVVILLTQALKGISYSI